ncbi:MAG TPA: hypothetical protein VNZ86_04295 [Bacteroidia bacterium]|jgi:hypothetical protein|nr:hypothetical protein [Bacteroidia bacterium]
MKKYILLVFLTIGYVHIYAQKKTNPPPKKTNSKTPAKDDGKEPLTYSVLRDNTKINFLSTGIDPFDMQVGNTFYMGLSANAEALYHNFFIHTEYNYHYVSADIGGSNRIDGESIYTPTNSNDFEILGGYFFTRVVDGKVPITLKVTGNGSGGHTTYYTKVDAQYEKFYGVECGVAKGVKLMFAEGQFNATDAFSGASSSFNGAFSTNMEYTWLYLGGSLGKMFDVAANFSEYGNKTGRCLKRIYAHVIIPLQSKLDDIYWLEGYGSSNPIYHKYVIDNTVPKGKVGFRIGFSQDFYSQIISGGGEFVLMPGLNGMSPMFRLKFQLGLNKIFGGG